MTSITPTPNVDSSSVSGSRAPKRTWLWVVVGLALAIGALAVIVWLVPASGTTQEEVFEGGVDRLVLNVTGSVTLVAGDRTELTVTKEWVFAGEPDVVVTQDNGTVEVNAYCHWFQIRCTTSVEGTVASGARVEVKTSAGAVEVNGTTGGVDLESSAGAIRAGNLTGLARLVTSAGNIVGTVTDGDVDAVTSAGSIDLTVLGDFISLSARTSAGNIDLSVTDEVYDVDADTLAGSVNIEVRTDPSATRGIVAQTSAGSIRVSPAP